MLVLVVFSKLVVCSDCAMTPTNNSNHKQQTGSTKLYCVIVHVKCMGVGIIAFL
jgi:hypothetical protein